MNNIKTPNQIIGEMIEFINGLSEEDLHNLDHTNADLTKLSTKALIGALRIQADSDDATSVGRPWGDDRGFQRSAEVTREAARRLETQEAINFQGKAMTA